MHAMASSLDKAQCQRRWIADVLVGKTAGIDTSIEDVESTVHAIALERVTALVANVLTGQASSIDELGGRLTVEARSIAGREMFRRSELTRVLAMLDRMHIKVLLLKGTALAYWLYPSPYLRECGDIDLLFGSRADAERAAKLLKQFGYDLAYVPGDLSYEMPCRRMSAAGLQMEVDIHWKIVNAPMFADVLGFDQLFADSRPLPRLAPSARGLSPVHALLHSAINRAVNLHTDVGDRLAWLYDIHLLVPQLHASEWQQLLDLCKTRGMSGVCDEAFAASVTAFDTAVPSVMWQALRSNRACERLDATRLQDWHYMQRRNILALPDLQTRLRWLWQRLLPPSRQSQDHERAPRGRLRLIWSRILRGVNRLHG